MKNIPIALAVLLGIGIIVVGTRFLLTPEASAADYGVPVAPEGDSGAYLAVKGVRDIASGLIGLTLLAVGERRIVGWFLLAAAAIPIGDAVIVLSHGGSPLLAYGMHGGTAAAMVLVALSLFRRRAPGVPGRGAHHGEACAPRLPRSRVRGSAAGS
ncbi:MAG: DUF4267 domain-containing protein [Nocardiopsaceae bacterium]|nr:DUF4267 domain-containing protein [Nocardiopsaceae bacterium]